MPLYGSSRLGEWRPRRLLDIAIQDKTVTTASGEKTYELSNHLGNVLAVISDEEKVVSATDYYAFGQEMVGRTFFSDDYRYGFNGKENDREWGESLIQDYGMRLYNPALCRFLSVDPIAKSYPELTVYQFASNTPIWAIDLDGLEAVLLSPSPDRKTIESMDIFANIFIVTKGEGAIANAPELKKIIQTDILNIVNLGVGMKARNDKGTEYPVRVNLTIPERELSYEDAIKLKNSSMIVPEEEGLLQENAKLVNSEFLVDGKQANFAWKNNVIVYKAAEGSDEYKYMVKEGLRAYYKTDPINKIKTITIRDVTNIENNGSATGLDASPFTKEKQTLLGFLHEVGHFLFQDGHPNSFDKKNFDKGPTSITAENDKNIILTPTNLNAASTSGRKTDANRIVKPVKNDKP